VRDSRAAPVGTTSRRRGTRSTAPRARGPDGLCRRSRGAAQAHGPWRALNSQWGQNQATSRSIRPPSSSFWSTEDGKSARPHAAAGAACQRCRDHRIRDASFKRCDESDSGTKLTVSPYACDFGAMWLQIRTSVRVTDRRGQSFKTTTEKAMNDATNVSERNLTWKWTSECSPQSIPSWCP